MTRQKKEKETKINWKKLLLAIIVCEAAGVIGTPFTTQAIPTWYSTLTKPSFNPPNWLFGPVWTGLYALMGLSLYLIWRSKPGLQKGFTEKLFYTQLILNAMWSILFFGLQNPSLALFEIIILWVLIVLTLLNAYRLNKTAGLLFVPYLMWVTFASILNWAIVMLN